MLRLGRPDKDLRSLLLFLKGEVSGKIWLKKLAVSARGLSDDYRYWLEFGRGRKTLATEAAVAGSALAQFDLDLAYLFRSVDLAADLTSGALRAFENEADLLPTSTSARVKRAFQKFGDVSEVAKRLARSRELSSFGPTGRIAVIHELTPLADPT